MAEERKTSIHGEWSSRWVYILAATGSAVGLGNIWKFPYITGENGGGAFVMVYLVCIAIIGIPVMMGEVLIGHRTKKSPVNALIDLSKEAGAWKGWVALGWLAMLSGYLILTYYSVVAGWALAYIFKAGSGAFTGASAEEISAVFDEMLAQPATLVIWMSIVIVFTLAIVGQGVQKGLEQAVRYMMPGLLIILILLVGYSMNSGKFMEGVAFLFQPDFSELTARGVLVALGHAFFTLSLASGVMMTYGAYLPEGTSIAKTSIAVAAADTIVALLAGLAIFPIVFANDLSPSEGPGLVFVTLPIAFGQMPFGTFFGTLFFLMLTLAAFTSAISLVEPSVAWLVERVGLPRGRAALFAGIGIWAIALICALSFNVTSEMRLFKKNFFDLMDFGTSNIMLPLGGLLIAIYTAWVMTAESTKSELELGDSHAYTTWQTLMRYVTPLAIIVMFLNALGLIDLTQ